MLKQFGSILLTMLWGNVPLFAQTATPQSVSSETAHLPPPISLASLEGLSATAWVQSSAEAKIAARQAYRTATNQLDVALRDKNWTAAVEQIAPYKKLKPAIILDLDETVFDNSFYQARLVRDNAIYSGPAWASWVAQADAAAIPGAVEFLNYANRKGVQIFYVTNRGTAEEPATRENLKRLGCPIQGPNDHVLMRGEQSNWTSDKTTRRQYVSQNHRVLLLIGDDLNDFVTAKPRTLQERDDLVNKYAPYWGERWILLSNPLYGSWEGAIYNYRNDLSREEMLRLKYGALQFRVPSGVPVAPVPNASTATR